MRYNYLISALLMATGIFCSELNAALRAEKSERGAIQARFAQFKKDLSCMFSKKGCTKEQQTRLLKQGFGLAATIIAITGGAWYLWPLSPEKAKKKYDTMKGFLNVVYLQPQGGITILLQNINAQLFKPSVISLYQKDIDTLKNAEERYKQLMEGAAKDYASGSYVQAYLSINKARTLIMNTKKLYDRLVMIDTRAIKEEVAK